jgi:hypothetical protein
MFFLVEGDGRLGPPEPGQGGEGVDGVHLLLSDAVLPAGLLCWEAPKDHEATLRLEELIVFLLAPSVGSLAFGVGFKALPCWPRVL